MSFKEAIKNVMRGGDYDRDAAEAIVANASRNASPAAKRKNPKLNRVKGKPATKGKAPAKPKAKKK